MGKTVEKVKELNDLVEENPDNEFVFCIVSDFKEVSGYLQMPELDGTFQKEIDLLAEIFTQRPVYAQLMCNALSKYFYDIRQHQNNIINKLNNQKQN